MATSAFTLNDDNASMASSSSERQYSALAESTPASRSPSASSATSSHARQQAPRSLSSFDLPTVSLDSSTRIGKIGISNDFDQSARLVSSLAVASIKHILYVKGQVSEPVAFMESQKRREDAGSITSERKLGVTGKDRKRDKLLSSLATLSTALEDACTALSTLKTPKQLSRTARDLSLVLVFGTSTMAPKDICAIHLSGAISERGDLTNEKGKEPESAVQRKDFQKSVAQMERKLVRFLVGDERLTDLSEVLAPAKVHVFLMAPPGFYCRGWTPKRNLNIDLNGLDSGPQAGVETSGNTLHASSLERDAWSPPPGSSSSDYGASSDGHSMATSSPACPARMSSSSSMYLDSPLRQTTTLNRENFVLSSPSSGSATSSNDAASSIGVTSEDSGDYRLKLSDGMAGKVAAPSEQVAARNGVANSDLVHLGPPLSAESDDRASTDPSSLDHHQLSSGSLLSPLSSPRPSSPSRRPARAPLIPDRARTNPATSLLARNRLAAASVPRRASSSASALSSARGIWSGSSSASSSTASLTGSSSTTTTRRARAPPRASGFAIDLDCDRCELMGTGHAEGDEANEQFVVDGQGREAEGEELIWFMSQVVIPSID